jgi:hypothetical protein
VSGASASAARMKSACASSTEPFGLPCLAGRTFPVACFSRAHVPAVAIPIETALPPDASIPRLRSPQPPAHANPCCTACPSHPPDSVARWNQLSASKRIPSDSLSKEFALDVVPANAGTHTPQRLV